MDLKIGNTPVVGIKNRRGARIMAKLEQLNPGGSIKDRIALTMIEEAEARGQLHPGMSIIESSSGNTAVGLAMIARSKGYTVYAVCDQNVPAGKLTRIAALGAHIIYLPPTPPGFDSVELRIAIADTLAAELPDAISTSQFSNPDNPLAHELGTGPEIWEQTGGEVTRIVAAVGTCGTITGVGHFLKARKPGIEIRAVEPRGSVIFGGERGNFLIQGGGLSFIPANLDISIVDTSTHVTDAEAISAIYRFADETGVLVGGTAGWVLHDLYRLCEEASANDVIVGILPDGADRYLDTIYSPDWLKRNGFALPARSSAPSVMNRIAGDLGCTVNTVEGGGRTSVDALYMMMGLPLPETLLDA
ncbi:cystathionine beta-synthase [Breoghania corrubedonensis]|uniref:Cysteine synthase B n=1 Tax=Breoghania corrubedonensis TaxID=665038 RepID=A0A2T5V9U4_9HYPH|nr:cysteine synthase family protein [Breoghania corrubedonensis]PTW60526.1 cystathionine beta-synthase [Breoghania corrubedonensis]